MDSYLVEYKNKIIGTYNNYYLAETFILSCLQNKFIEDSALIHHYRKNSCFKHDTRIITLTSNSFNNKQKKSVINLNTLSGPSSELSLADNILTNNIKSSNANIKLSKPNNKSSKSNKLDIGSQSSYETSSSDNTSDEDSSSISSDSSDSNDLDDSDNIILNNLKKGANRGLWNGKSVPTRILGPNIFKNDNKPQILPLNTINEQTSSDPDDNSNDTLFKNVSNPQLNTVEENSTKLLNITNERTELQHRINMLKKQKEKIDESKQVYETDIKLFKMFKVSVDTIDNFIIPELFAKKYAIFNKLFNEDKLSWENFVKNYKNENYYGDYFSENSYEEMFINNENNNSKEDNLCTANIDEEVDIDEEVEIDVN